MKPKKVNTMTDELIICISFLAVGLALYSPFLSETLKNILRPIVLTLLILLLLVSLGLKRQRSSMSPEEQRDLDREGKDERSLMLKNRAAWLCQNTEDCILAFFWVVFLCRDDRRIVSLLYWILVGRRCLFLAVRWWLNRKY